MFVFLYGGLLFTVEQNLHELFSSVDFSAWQLCQATCQHASPSVNYILEFSIVKMKIRSRCEKHVSKT